MEPRILVVDDEQDIREMVRRHFQFLGYQVLTAGNGKEALEILAGNKIDIVISDIIMPVMDGVELLRNIRNDYPMTRAIMITGYVTLENALACMRYGADTCIFKPLEDLSLLEKAVVDAVKQIQHWFAILKQLTDKAKGQAYA